jgi:uncharacterized protein
VVKPGDVVSVKVLEVDVPRNRISLTLRLDDELPAAGKARPGERRSQGNREQRGPRRGPDRQARPEGAMADALRRAGLG